ncbi:MAG: hypothetical protein H6Q07_1613 [Acidobacteria bacterium]|nr:hypothetical protein [Acidobacteriota bacterium]
MSFFTRFGLAVAALILVCGAAAPVSRAQQSRILDLNVLRPNSSGAYLGIEMSDVTSANMAQYKLSDERGVIVRSVQAGSPAAKANLQADDVILEYAGTPVWSSYQFSRLVEETPPGRKVDLVVSRAGKRATLTAEVGMREGSRRSSQDRQMEITPDDLGQMFPGFPFRYNTPGDNRFSAQPAQRPRLGVTLQPLTGQLGEYFGVPENRGALVSSVVEGSPSAGKLKSGDVIIAADGKDIRGPEELMDLIRDKNEGTLTLKVIRDKKEISVVVNLPDRPSGDGSSGPGIRL